MTWRTRPTRARARETRDGRYLATLQPTLEKLSLSMTDADSFQALTDVFRPTVHLIMLIWKHSKFYNTPARLVVLMREICNDLIAQARAFVSPDQLFEIEAQEAVEVRAERTRPAHRSSRPRRRSFRREPLRLSYLILAVAGPTGTITLIARGSA